MSKGQFGKKFCADCSKPIWSVSTWCKKCSCKHKPPISKKTRVKIRNGKLGKKNPNWKGDNITYGALHIWGRRNFPKPKFCEMCNIKPAHDLANKGTYNRDIKNWEWLCRKCHMTKDGRLSSLHNKLSCKRGHEYNEKNTHFYTYPNGKKQRFCRECKKYRLFLNAQR